jgi:galactose oxidase
LDNITGSGTVFTATLPSDSGILLPGSYYLFVVSAQSVPSLAHTVQVTL